MEKVLVKVLPTEQDIEVEKGTSLLKALHGAHIYVEGTCGGRGTCGKCKVKIVEGKVPLSAGQEAKLSSREIEEGYRLACKTPVDNEMTIVVPEEQREGSRKSALSDGLGLEVDLDLRKVYVKMEKPSLGDQRADVERLAGQLGLEAAGQFSLDVIRSLPNLLRKSGFKATAVVRGDKVIALEPGDTRAKMYGVAFDIGTTTVVGSLIDLNSSRILATFSAGNPQRTFGADVISRITYASQESNGLQVLNEKIIEGINQIVKQLVESAGINYKHIYEMTMVGNTTMQHLFIGVDPTYLAQAPYIPAVQRPLELETRELGIRINPNGRIHVLPNIAGYVGSDTVGVILASHLEKSEKVILAVDIGTNGEVVLGSRDRLLACSTAAGPAFEGAQIKFGMRAADGAIERVKIDGSVEVKTIGNAPAVGICGSGLIDAVAELLKAGVIDPSGRIVSPAELPQLPEYLRSRIVEGEHGYDFVLATEDEGGLNEPVTLTQKDVRELQLAKGAIHAGIKILSKELQVSVDEIAEVLLAGAFGSYIDKESALRIGLLPALPAEKVRSVGNAAGVGSQMALVSREQRERAAKIAGQVEYIELSTRVDFQEEFMMAINFPS